VTSLDTPRNRRLAEAIEVAEDRRLEVKDLSEKLNAAQTSAATAQASEAAALARVEELEAEVKKLQAGWAGREALLEEMTRASNEAKAAAAVATQAQQVAEGQLAQLQTLYSEAKSTADRLLPENASLRDRARLYESKVASVEEKLQAVVESTVKAVERIADAAQGAIPAPPETRGEWETQKRAIEHRSAMVARVAAEATEKLKSEVSQALSGLH
jgi:chromosome segregation ATPase